MPENDPDANTPPDGYFEGLESYLFQPYRRKWVEIIQESRNSSTNNPWFQHVSTYFIQPQPLIAKSQFPAVFVLTPNATFERHGKKQFKALISLQIEYYSRHVIRNVTNELEHFAERILYLMQANPNLGFYDINGSIICQSELSLDLLDFDYYVSQKHVIRSCVVTAIASIPLLTVEPP